MNREKKTPLVVGGTRINVFACSMNMIESGYSLVNWLWCLYCVDSSVRMPGMGS